MGRRGDPVAVLEAIYSLEHDDDTWLDEVHAAFGPILDDGFGTALVAFETRGEVARVSSLRFRGPIAEQGTELFKLHEQRCFEYDNGQAPPPPCHESRFFLDLPPCSMSHATFRAPPRSGARTKDARAEDPFLRDWRATKGTAGPRLDDILQVRSDGEPGRGVVFGAGRKSGGVPKDIEGLAPRLASHLGAMLRLRGRRQGGAMQRGPEGGDAILTFDGKLSHARADATTHASRDALQHAARMVDRARGKLRRTEPETALALWGAMVAGRWTLVEQFDHDGKRFMVAYRNHVASPSATFCNLGQRERQVATLAALGHSNKLIAYELGLSVSAVSAYLARAAKKLGADSRVALVRLYRDSLVPRT
ncbi:LuxR C-terminal-related transcriptional regulator [Pendulispora rubella]|uniref:LuxR C-terminal-related transcriptional regulator n=1 Tax=Pendulispora rubella TaxID=2741070 RepID=A0ABZ2LCN2_9BACT